MDIFEMIEKAKKSEDGATWFSDKGPIHISKEGDLIPIGLKELPKYQPERSKREDSIISESILNILPTTYKDIHSNEPIKIIHCEFGCSIPITFNTSDGMKTIYPGKKYDENFNEI